MNKNESSLTWMILGKMCLQKASTTNWLVNQAKLQFDSFPCNLCFFFVACNFTIAMNISSPLHGISFNCWYWLYFDSLTDIFPLCCFPSFFCLVCWWSSQKHETFWVHLSENKSKILCHKRSIQLHISNWLAG